MSLTPKLRAKAVRDIELLQKHGNDLRDYKRRVNDE